MEMKPNLTLKYLTVQELCMYVRVDSIIFCTLSYLVYTQVCECVILSEKYDRKNVRV